MTPYIPKQILISNIEQKEQIEEWHMEEEEKICSLFNSNDTSEPIDEPMWESQPSEWLINKI